MSLGLGLRVKYSVILDTNVKLNDSRVASRLKDDAQKTGA